MANTKLTKLTKLTKRKEEGDTQQVKPDSDSKSELPQNQGNDDLVVDDLSHVHNKCDDFVAKLKALNQVVEDMPMASVVSTSPFVTPVVTPVHDSTDSTVRSSENLSKVAVTADAISEGLINYLTNPVVVEINTGLVELNGQFSNIQPVEANVLINKARVQQPIKSIGEMLNELPKSRKRNDHIQIFIFKYNCFNPCL